MLKYKIDVIAALKKAGYSQGKLLRERYFGGRDLEKLRNGIVLGNIGLDKLCTLLHCQPGRLIEWIPDEKAEETK